MAVVYSDSFTGTTVNPFWNSTQRVTQNGSLSIAAGGNYIGATGVAPAANYREVQFDVVSGDRPGLKLFWDGAEFVSLTAIPASGLIDVSQHGVSRGQWSYPGTNRRWRMRWNGLGMLFSTSGDGGATWVDAGTVDPVTGVALVDNECGALNGLFVNSAGNGVGTGTSTLPTVIDNFVWQDWAPPAISFAAGVIAAGVGANENPLSAGGLVVSPGLIDGHVAMARASNALIGVGTPASALTARAFGPGLEATCTLAADTPDLGEPTLFLCNANPKNGYVVWTDWRATPGTSDYYLGRFDNGGFTGLQPALRTPGGRVLAGQRLGLAHDGAFLSFALDRGSGWQLVARLADARYPATQVGLGAVNGVTYSQWTGGATVSPTPAAVGLARPRRVPARIPPKLGRR